MQAVTGQLLRRHIIADLAAGCALGQQVPDEVAELLVGSGHMRTAMQQRCQVAAVMLVDSQRVGLQDRLEPLASVTGVVLSRVASRTARRCASIVSSHSLGTTSLYATTIARHSDLTET
jgi:hypothetical protein